MKKSSIVGWVSSKGEGVKKVSAWDWFDFSQLTENASLVEFYKDVELSEKRNKDNPSLDQYHFEHDRYWGYSRSKIPFVNDKYS